MPQMSSDKSRKDRDFATSIVFFGLSVCGRANWGNSTTLRLPQKWHKRINIEAQCKSAVLKARQRRAVIIQQ